MLTAYDHALPIMRTTHVPITIYGHTVHIHCDVVPRALKFCHLMLGKSWCAQFKIVFGSENPDPSIFWNSKHTWLSYTRIKEFQEIRHQNLRPPVAIQIKPHVGPVLTPPELCIRTMCTPQPPQVNLHDSTLCVDMSVHKSESVIFPEKLSEGVDRTCKDISTNVTMSTPSVVSCDMQVAF
jgi:hypothetical protein